ncbi:MAG: ABC transporter permease [Acidobacteriia bacterium]|nr:ABC transporter permease [Terriglobia bacterium]
MWWWKPAKEHELEEEIAAHFEIEIERRIAAGETREQAERAARREFGNVALVREVTREMWGYERFESFFRDLKYALRGMRKSPAFSAAVILTMGLAVGASTAVFSVVNGVLLRPLPYPQAERIAMVWRLAPVSTAFGGDEYPWGRLDFSLFQQQTKAFESLGAFQPDTFNLTGSGEPAFLEGMRASAGFFPALGVLPAIGRFYNAEEDRKGRELVVVLSDRLWRDRFGADRNIVGRAIELNGLDYTVVGVMPPGFSFPHAEELPATLEFPREAQLWVPLAIAPERGPNELAVVGRLAPHATILQAQAELDVFAGTFARMFPTAKDWSRSRAVSLQKQIVGDTDRPLWLLLAAVGLVLLIASSNVAGLVLARSLGRRREFHLRAALGAGRGRLVRQLLTENLLLAGAGGVLGIALAAAGIQFVKNFGPQSLPRLREVSLDPTVFAFCLVVTPLAGLLFGLAPGIGLAGAGAADSLKTGTRIAGRQFSSKLRNCLLIGQVALALMLVIAAGLLVRTFYGLLSADRGFRAEHVLTFEISLPPAHYPDPGHMAQLYSRTLHALRSLPGVEAAGLVHAVPMGGAPDATGIRVPGHVAKPNEQLYANYMFASSGYFAAAGTPLLEGRDFSDLDTLDSMHVAVVNRAMANALWPGESAVGKHVGVADTRYPVRTVIGVVANVKQSSLREEAAPQMYVPYSQSEIVGWPPMQTMQIALRTAADPAGMTASIRQAMRSVDPALPLAKVAALTTLVQQSLAQPRFAMLLLAAFSVLALVLASVGMYGAISYSVAQRTQEIGIRMALGAERATVFGMVLSQGARLTAAGIAIGLVGAEGTMRLLSGFLYGVRPADPLTFGAVSALLAAVALLACYLPARRAMRVDPIIALRSE